MVRIKERIKSYFDPGIKFKRELRRQMRMLITFTLGFTIAFTWRQTIFDASQSFINWVIGIKDSVTSSIITSVFITLSSVLLIYLSSQ